MDNSGGYGTDSGLRSSTLFCRGDLRDVYLWQTAQPVEIVAMRVSGGRVSFARRRQFRSALGALILLASCTHSQDSKHPKLNSRTIRVQAPIALDDDTATILARPSYVSSDSAGRIFVADRSDKDIKLYTATGKRIGHIGRAGAGPGEFEYLATAQVMGDSLVAYDVIKRRLTLFDRLGRVGRVVTLEANTFDIRVVDDSLLLLIRHPSAHGKLLKLIHRDGSVVSEFFTLDNFFDDPQLRYLTALWADARDGYVFVNIFGEDSLFVFDYAGHRVAAGPPEGIPQRKAPPKVGGPEKEAHPPE